MSLDKPLVLVVDDEESIRSSLSNVLSDEGFSVITASNGEEALELVQSDKPALVFLDIWMPGWDGIETLEKIKAFDQNVEVIMISGHATIANALEASKRGAFDFIEKPLSIDSVLLSAERALLKHDLNTDDSSVDVKSILSHRGVLSKGLSGNNCGQRTIKNSIVLYGKGLHSGQKSGLVLEPLPLNSGIHFAKIGETKTVPALVDFIESTDFATRLTNGEHAVATIEHLLSALHAYKISNLLIKCNVEVPILDGSAIEFCKALDEAGIVEQGGDWYEIAVDEPFVFDTEDGQKITIEPSDHFEINYRLVYPDPIGEQSFSYVLDSAESYKENIAPARTFGFMKDIDRLQKAGLAAGGSLNNFILIGDDKVVNTDLRFPEELARHKVLDAIGDLFLLGRPLRVKVTAEMTGHSDNIDLLKQIAEKVFV